MIVVRGSKLIFATTGPQARKYRNFQSQQQERVMTTEPDPFTDGAEGVSPPLPKWGPDGGQLPHKGRGEYSEKLVVTLWFLSMK